MAYKTDLLTKRLNRVERKIFPPESVAAKIRALSPHDRAVYDDYKRKRAEWSKSRPGELAYMDILADIDGETLNQPIPRLPQYIRNKIYPCCKPELSAQQHYMNLVESLR